METAQHFLKFQKSSLVKRSPGQPLQSLQCFFKVVGSAYLFLCNISIICYIAIMVYSRVWAMSITITIITISSSTSSSSTTSLARKWCLGWSKCLITKGGRTWTNAPLLQVKSWGWCVCLSVNWGFQNIASETNFPHTPFLWSEN